MTLQGSQLQASLGIPELDGFIMGSGHDPLAVW